MKTLALAALLAAFAAPAQADFVPPGTKLRVGISSPACARLNDTTGVMAHIEAGKTEWAAEQMVAKKCRTLAVGSIVTVEENALATESLCVRPSGARGCLWVKADLLSPIR